MFVAVWAAVAFAFGVLVAWIAHRKGRELIPWGIYGSVAGLIALPHALMLEPRQDDRNWVPIRFGLPSGPQSCPKCLAQIHQDAVVCRHCGAPLYTRPATMAPPQEPVPGTVPPMAHDQLNTADHRNPATDAAPRAGKQAEPGELGGELHMAGPAFFREPVTAPEERRSVVGGHLVSALVLCVVTVVSTVWLSGRSLPSLEEVLSPDARRQGAPTAAGTASEPVARQPPVMLEAPKRQSPSLSPLPPPSEGAYIPPRGTVPPAPEAPKSSPPVGQAPPADLAGDVRAVLGKLRPKAEATGEKDAPETAAESVVAMGDMIKELQLRLRGEGLDPGPIDGRAGRRTLKAVRAFQAQEGLPVTGAISEAVLSRLGLIDPSPPKMILEVTRRRNVDARGSETASDGSLNTE